MTNAQASHALEAIKARVVVLDAALVAASAAVPRFLGEEVYDGNRVVAVAFARFFDGHPCDFVRDINRLNNISWLYVAQVGLVHPGPYQSVDIVA